MIRRLIDHVQTRKISIQDRGSTEIKNEPGQLDPGPAPFDCGRDHGNGNDPEGARQLDGGPDGQGDGPVAGGGPNHRAGVMDGQGRPESKLRLAQMQGGPDGRKEKEGHGVEDKDGAQGDGHLFFAGICHRAESGNGAAAADGGPGRDQEGLGRADTQEAAHQGTQGQSKDDTHGSVQKSRAPGTDDLRQVHAKTQADNAGLKEKLCQVLALRRIGMPQQKAIGQSGGQGQRRRQQATCSQNDARKKEVLRHTLLRLTGVRRLRPRGNCDEALDFLMPGSGEAPCAFPWDTMQTGPLFPEPYPNPNSGRSTTVRMARIYPFRALRYNPALVRVQDCVTQPYDKITPAMQQAYYQKSPYNLVRIILGLPELFDGKETGDVYTRAARDFRAWRESGVLMQEQEPCVFAYSQKFTVPGANGRTLERRGFIALGGLHDYSEGVVFRHEQTLSKPKSDRLNLLRATRAHFGQIFMLYSDPGLTAEKLLFSEEAVPDIEVTDEYDVLHRVWKISDPNTINILISALADKKLIIADGHHRYETALNYSKEHAPAQPVTSERSTNSLPQPPYPEAAVMMTFVNMDAEGLVILPTHRVVFGLEGFAAAAFLEKAKEFFEVQPTERTDASALTTKLAEAGKGKTAFIAVTKDGSHLLTAKPEAMAKALSGLSERQRQLDVAQLHGVVLEKLLGLTAEAVREQTHLRYLRDAGEAIEQVLRGDADAAFLMNPVTMPQLREVAFAGEVMPQKSTDFFPKLLSGLAIYPLD